MNSAVAIGEPYDPCCSFHACSAKNAVNSCCTVPAFTAQSFSRMISLIFGLACGLGAAAGVLIGPMQSVQVEMGYLMLMKAFAAAVVGGFGSLPGAIIGGIMVGVFENLGAAYISASHKDIYAFLLLILVLMFKPSGLLGVDAKVKA